MTSPDPFVLLATLTDPAAAELCAAQLRSEGIESRLRGESLGPYRLTIGEMAATQVWVPLGRIEDARRLVLQGDVGDAHWTEPEPEEVPASPGSRWGALTPALGALLLALALWLLLTRLL